MKTKIILTVDDDLSDQEVHDLQYLFSDALGGFAAMRADPASYVDTRYPGPDYYPDREEKVQQVARRVRLARKLHNASLHPVVEQQHVNHAICVATNTPCSRTCFAEGEEEISLLTDETAAAAKRARASLGLLQSMFGMTEEEARATYNRLEDKRINALMVAQGLAKPASMEDFPLRVLEFKQVFDHEVKHKAAGNPVDFEALIRFLRAVFS